MRYRNISGQVRRAEALLFHLRWVGARAEVTEAVVAAARSVASPATSAEVTVAGNTITVPVDKPERDNPNLVKAIVAAGGEVQFVSGTAPTLEETYLKLLGEQKHDKKDAR